jgi:hypothetical protein
MTAIRIETTINSETLHLPQLKPLVGKSVEIIVRERVIPVVTAGRGEWAAVEAAALALDDYDFKAYREIRNTELNMADGSSQ